MRGGSGLKRKREEVESTTPLSLSNTETSLVKKINMKQYLENLKYEAIFRRESNINTLQRIGKKLFMNNSNGTLTETSVIIARSHGHIVGAIKCPKDTAIITSGHGDYVDHNVYSVMAPAVIKLLFKSSEEKPALDNFKNFLKLKLGWSGHYGPDSLINSVSYKTPGSYVKNVLLTKSANDYRIENDPLNDFRGVYDITDSIVQNVLEYNDFTHQKYALDLEDKKDLTTLTSLKKFIETLIKAGGRTLGIGGERRDLKYALDHLPPISKYKLIKPLTDRMYGQTMFSGITTEEILNELHTNPDLGYKGHIIFLIVYACGSWAEGIDKKIRKQIKLSVGAANGYSLDESKEFPEPPTPFNISPNHPPPTGYKTVISSPSDVGYISLANNNSNNE